MIDKIEEFSKRFGLIQDKKALSLAFSFVSPNPAFLSAEMQKELVTLGVLSGKMVRVLLHYSADDDLHTMVVFHPKDSFFAPHRHKHKSESYHILEGRVKLVLFDDNGDQISSCIIDADSVGGMLCHVPRGMYHLLAPLDDYALVHESRPGPFTAEGDMEFAPWFSSEESNIREYLANFHQKDS